MEQPETVFIPDPLPEGYANAEEWLEAVRAHHAAAIEAAQAPFRIWTNPQVEEGS